MTQHPVQGPEREDGGAGGMSGAAGRAFAGLFRLLKLARPERPIHPKGLALTGELTRTGSPAAASGVDWLDSAGTDGVTARFSRSVGLPQLLPDVLGLALRVTATPGSAGRNHQPGPADVLLASTGWRVPGRFLLRPRLDVAGATMTTLMPYRGRLGPVLLGLRTVSLPPGPLSAGEWVLRLFWAKPAGPWHPCGELRLNAGPAPADTGLRFNPLAHRPPGAETYPWARKLREHSYRAAQRQAPAAVVRSPQTGPPANT